VCKRCLSVLAALLAFCLLLGACGAGQLERTTDLALCWGHPLAQMGDTVYFLESASGQVWLTAWEDGAYRQEALLENGDPNNTGYLYADGDSLYFLGQNGHLFALDLRTGAERPVGDGQLYTACFALTDGRLYYLDGFLDGPLAALDLKSGEAVALESEICPRNNDLCFYCAHIYYISAEDRCLWRTDRDGSAPEKWSGEARLHRLIPGNGCLYAADADGSILRLPDGFWGQPEAVRALARGAAPLAVRGEQLWYLAPNGTRTELWVLAGDGQSRSLGTAAAWEAAVTDRGVFLRQPGTENARWQVAP